MMTISELACFMLIFPNVLAVNVTYHFKNETVVLPCEQLSDYPIIWYGPPNLSTYAIGKDINQNLSKSDRLLIAHTNGFPQYNLKIRYFSIDDRGLYKCVRRGPYNKVQEIYFDLEITKAPRNLTIENEDSNNIVYGYLNKPFNLTCNVIEGIPKGQLVWIVNNKTVKEAAASSLVYFLRPQQNDHLKLLSCATMSYKTGYMLQRTVQLFVYMPPDVWISPNHSMYILNEGDDLSIYCKYISNHEITKLEWGRLLTINSQLEYIQSSANLSIQNIKSENAGQYVCTVSNMAGNDSETVSIEVHLPPDVWISPNHSMYIFNEGDNLSIYCKYISNHEITELEWGRLLTINSQLEYIQSSANLTIQNIKRENAGRYVCTVSNMAGKDSETVSIEVHLPPNVWISTDHNAVILDEGDNLTLYCNYSSNHNITDLKWNRLLPTKSQLWTSQSSPDLFIRNIQRVHAGQYVCTVSNMAGNGSDNVTIKVNSPLKAPQNIMAVAFSDRIIVKWTSDLDIGLQETFVVEYRKHVESSWSQVFVEDRYTAVINGLVADTVYLVRVYSRTPSRKSYRTDNIIVKTEKQHFNGIVFPLEFAVIFGGVLLIPYLCFCGLKAFKKRQKFCRNNDRVRQPHRHAETSVQPAHYDEIDSMYYNPINETISPQNIRNNTQRTPSTGNANFELSEVNNSSSENTTPYIDHQLIKSSHENISPGSSSDESYLVPCRNYIDFDLENITENQHLEINVDEPEIPNDESSVSSDNSETNIKSFRSYESLKGSNMNEHCYKSYNDIDV